MPPSTSSIDLAGYFSSSRLFFYIITDQQGDRAYANDLFDTVFKRSTDVLPLSSSFTNPDEYFEIIRHCVLQKETRRVAVLAMKLTDDRVKMVKWEFSVLEHDNKLCVQGIGSFTEEALALNGTDKTDRLASAIPERYTAYEKSPEGLWRFDSVDPITASLPPDEILQYWKKNAILSECNDSLARMYGFEKASDLIGVTLEQLIDFSDEGMLENMRKFIRNGLRSMQVETKEFDRYGNPKHFLNHMEGTIEEGKIIRVWGTQIDITEQRKAEEKNLYLASLMESVSDIIISQDVDFNIVSWNKAAQEVYGYSPEEMIGRKILEVLHFEYQGIDRTEFFEIVEKQGSWKGEAYTTNRMGKPITVLATITKIINERGKHTGYVSVSKDITENRKAQEQVQRSELFYRNLIAESLDGVLLTDEKGDISFASTSVTKILGYEPEELHGTNMFKYVFPEDVELAAASFTDEVKMRPRVKFINIRLLHKSGNIVWCVVRGHNMLDNPYVSRMVIYFADDTLRKNAEQALVESEKRFRRHATVLNNVTDVIVTVDINRVVTSWNKILERLSGITEKEAMGRSFREVILTDYSPYTNDQVAAIVLKEGIWRGEVSFTGQDGEKKYLLHTISVLHDEQGENIGMLGVGKDITERKKIEARLQQSESFYRTLATNSLDGIVMTDAAGKINYCGPSILKISGYDVADLLGRNIFDYVHPEEISSALEAFSAEMNSGSNVNYIVIRLRHAVRGWVWCTVRGHNLLEDPVLRSMVIYFTDDTKRKHIEDRLRESESRFRDLIHNLRLGIILLNERSETIVCNQAALNMLGVTEDQLMNRTYEPRWNVIHEDGTDFSQTDYPVPTAIQTKKPVRDVVMGILKPFTNDRVWVLVNAEPLLNEEGKIINVICSFADITEQRRLSQELIEQEVQRQRLITQATIDGQEKERQEIGKELHDNINQHLTTTRLYLEVASDKSSGAVLEMIRLAHKSLTDIVNEIRKLSQSLVPPTLGDLGLTESIQDLCDSLHRTHSYHIEFHHRHFNEEYLPGNLKLMIFRIIQEQVNNIIRHAQARLIRIKLQADAENIIFSIADDGCGFDPTHYKKGMGISNITNRASLFSGRAEIEAAPGKGCTITVTIPLTEAVGTLN
ncbi:MAG TPA: PAS domain S-box protein [Chitinophagaceae bacterium]|nr:PAS domain S-box protein [Chitinophagaceae bacterium]